MRRSSDLERITLPALAYGASLSGITVGQVTGTKVPSPRAWEPVTQPHRKYMQQIRVHAPPPSTGFSPEQLPPLRPRTATISGRRVYASHSCLEVPVRCS